MSIILPPPLTVPELSKIESPHRIIVSDPNGSQSYFEYYAGGSDPVPGCADSSACNYDADATEDDGSCEYAMENYDCDGNCTAGEDCNGECGGSAVVDECGVCGGDGIPQGECDIMGEPNQWCMPGEDSIGMVCHNDGLENEMYCFNDSNNDFI